jgi:hypothetical protein
MTINYIPPHRRILIVIVSLQQEQSRGILHDNVITTLPDMTHGTSITDVMHIPDPKHGTIIRANHNTSYTSVLRVCVAANVSLCTKHNKKLIINTMNMRVNTRGVTCVSIFWGSLLDPLNWARLGNQNRVCPQVRNRSRELISGWPAHGVFLSL